MYYFLLIYPYFMQHSPVSFHAKRFIAHLTNHFGYYLTIIIVVLAHGMMAALISQLQGKRLISPNAGTPTL